MFQYPPRSIGDKVETVRVRSLESGHELNLLAPFFADATETGELLPLTKTEYVTGAESQKETGELHAKPEAQPQNMQAFTCCFAMEYLPRRRPHHRETARVGVLARLRAACQTRVAG